MTRVPITATTNLILSYLSGFFLSTILPHPFSGFCESLFKRFYFVRSKIVDPVADVSYILNPDPKI